MAINHINGHPTGYVPRDYKDFPLGCDPLHTKQWDLPLLSRQEAKERSEYLNAKGLDPLSIAIRRHALPTYQNGYGYCLPPGALIRMADGSDKPIANVTLGDRVYTAEGNVSTVEQLHRRKYDGNMVDVCLWGHSHLSLTPNHSVLTKRGYVPAGELTKDDYVKIPKATGVECKVLQVRNHISRVAAYAGGGRQDDTWNNHSTKELPDLIELTPEFGRLIGLFMAEGFTDTYEVCFAFNSNERDTLVADTIELVHSCLGEVATAQENKANGIVVSFCGKQWASLFNALCGKYAHGKRLHGDLMSGPVEFLKALFDGWMDGDGCHKHNARFGATVSRLLAQNMFAIANKIGLCPSINKERPQENKYAKSRKPVWKIRVSDKLRKNYQSYQDSTASWRKVKELRTTRYVGHVYNIGVAGDNSYIAESIGVHNCWAHAATMALKLSFAMSGQVAQRLSATAMAAKVKGYRDRGGNAFEAFPFMAEHGIPTVDLWPENSVDRSLDTPEMQANAKLHRVLEWYELPDNSDEHKWTALCTGFAIWTGYGNIGHAMCAARYEDNGSPTSWDINSWNRTASSASEWNQSWLNDRNVIWKRSGRNFRCFEQYAIRVSTATG